MPNYEYYTMSDFALDDHFIRWCLNPTEEDDIFWKTWMGEDPTRNDVIKQARKLVTDIHFVQKSQNFATISHDIWKNIEFDIEQNKKTERENSKVGIARIFSLRKISIAAACIAFLLISIQFFDYISDESTNRSSISTWVAIENNTLHIKKITFPDSSFVSLEPYSSIKYEKPFKDNQRTVVLNGEAFFDVARDVKRPFIVYANQTITKVLGTSFKISAFEGQKSVKVDVITGKVAVYGRVNNGTSNKVKQIILETDVRTQIPQPNKKLEVTPNQSVIFNEDEQEMIKTISDIPKILEDKKHDYQFEFNDEPVIKVFSELERIYGIAFQFDSKKLANCTIKTKLDDEPLMQKVAIICAALNLQYTEKDAVILINGGYCQK